MKIEKAEYTETQGTVLEPDMYEAVLTGFGQYEGNWGPRCVWQFEIAHPETGEVVEAAAFTSFKMGEKPRKSQLLKYAEALNNGEDVDGMDLDDLLGRPCRVDVENYTKQNGIQKNVVNDVKKPKKGQKGKEVDKESSGLGASGKEDSSSGGGGASNSESVEFNEEDFNDIPFRHVSRRAKLVEDIL